MHTNHWLASSRSTRTRWPRASTWWHRARPADLTAPTPCADWTLHGLISHMAAQHYGFAAAAAGDGDLARWRPRRLGADPVADYRAAAHTVLAAFAADGVLDRRFPLPEFAAGAALPRAAGDQLPLHRLRRALLGRRQDPRSGGGVPAGRARRGAAGGAGPCRTGSTASRRAPRSRPSLAWAAVRPLDLIVAILGRSPDWQRPALPAHGRCWPRKVRSAWLNWASASRLGRCPAPSMATS